MFVWQQKSWVAIHIIKDKSFKVRLVYLPDHMQFECQANGQDCLTCSSDNKTGQHLVQQILDEILESFDRDLIQASDQIVF